MAKGIMVCEGQFEGYVTKRSKELLKAYAEGFHAGADKYGAGHGAVYTRDDLPHVDADDAALIEKYLSSKGDDE